MPRVEIFNTSPMAAQSMHWKPSHSNYMDCLHVKPLKSSGHDLLTAKEIWEMWCIDIAFWCMLCKSNYDFLECILLPVCSHDVHVFHDI